jgi:hypothetical protein
MSFSNLAMEVNLSNRYDVSGSASSGGNMNKNKHLTQEERLIIERRLLERESFKSIGRELCKDPTTIAKEIKNHIQFRKVGCYGRCFNDCLIRNYLNSGKLACGQTSHRQPGVGL